MKRANLTRSAAAATSSAMNSRGVWKTGPVLGLIALGGCINVNAPSEPIVIELNINIRQEVIYRLAEDVRDNVEENADIF